MIEVYCGVCRVHFERGLVKFKLTGLVNQSIIHTLEHLVTTYSGDDMYEKVAMNLKVLPVTRELIAECARLEHRTVSAYVDAMVEVDAKKKGLILVNEENTDE